MEYTIRNSSHELPTTLVLSEYALIIKSGKEERTIPYICIQQVKLKHDANRIYQATFLIEGLGPLIISNKYHTGSKTIEDRSRAYSTFIRVFHYYLKDKSKATYFSMRKTSKLWLWISLSALVSFGISFVADYFEVALMDPVIQGLILAVLIGTVILAFKLGRGPKTYSPTDIPIEFLP